jgi:uncharacterized protein HemY
VQLYRLVSFAAITLCVASQRVFVVVVVVVVVVYFVIDSIRKLLDTPSDVEAFPYKYSVTNIFNNVFPLPLHSHANSGNK